MEGLFSLQEHFACPLAPTGWEGWVSAMVGAGQSALALVRYGAPGCTAGIKSLTQLRIMLTRLLVSAAALAAVRRRQDKLREYVWVGRWCPPLVLGQEAAMLCSIAAAVAVGERQVALARQGLLARLPPAVRGEVDSQMGALLSYMLQAALAAVDITLASPAVSSFAAVYDAVAAARGQPQPPSCPSTPAPWCPGRCGNTSRRRQQPRQSRRQHCVCRWWTSRGSRDRAGGQRRGPGWRQHRVGA